MKKQYKQMLKVLTEVEVAVELNSLLFAQAIGIKKDPLSEFIAKYVFTEYNKGNSVSMAKIVNTLHESDNTIRKKLKNLVAIKFLKVTNCNKDSRTVLYKPTKLLQRVYTVDMAKKLKSLQELAPMVDFIFASKFNDLYVNNNVEHYKSYIETTSTEVFAKQALQYQLDLLKDDDTKISANI